MDHRQQLIAPCVMDCALCANYQVNKYGYYKKGTHRKGCIGCRPRGLSCIFMTNTCDSIGQQQIEFCFECQHYPCVQLKRLDKRYRTKYHLSMIENLNQIKNEGLSSFIKHQEKWNCSKCHEPISCHNGLCMNCDFDVLKSNPKYHWDHLKTK